MLENFVIPYRHPMYSSKKFLVSLNQQKINFLYAILFVISKKTKFVILENFVIPHTHSKNFGIFCRSLQPHRSVQGGVLVRNYKFMA